MARYLHLSKRMPLSKKSMTIKEARKLSTDLIASENKSHTTLVPERIYSKRFTTLMVSLTRMSNNSVLILTQLTTSKRHTTI